MSIFFFFFFLKGRMTSCLPHFLKRKNKRQQMTRRLLSASFGDQGFSKN
jgi:hypothetical protein